MSPRASLVESMDFERGSRSGGPAAVGVLVAVSTWLAACPGLEVEFEKVGQEPVSERRPVAPASLEELTEASLISRLPPREEQLSGTGGWRLHEVGREVARRAHDGLLSDRAWVDLLMREDMIHTRPRWPANVPFEIWLRRPNWIEAKRIVVEAIEPPIGRVEWAGKEPKNGCVIDHGYRHLRFESLPMGTRRVTFEVSIDAIENPWSPYTRLREPRTSWKGRLQLPVELVERPEDCLSAAKSPPIDAAVRESLFARLASGSIGFEQDNEERPLLAGVGISLGVELLNEGQVVERRKLRVESTVTPVCSLETLPRKLAQDPAALAHWQVRVLGDPGSALTLWEADRWWDGELTIPLAELIERGR